MRKGISLVVLIITIIVLIVLTAAVVLTGMQTPENAQLAVFYNNIENVQEAVTLKMMNNMSHYAIEEVDINRYKWVGIIQGYDETQAQIGNPNFVNSVKEINGINVLSISEKMSTMLSIENVALGANGEYYIDENGVVYHEGTTINGITYYNRNVIKNQGEGISARSLQSIVITRSPTKTRYVVGEVFNEVGMVVTATYSDLTTAIITDYILSPNTTLQTTNDSITISYTESGVTKTATQSIIVDENISNESWDGLCNIDWYMANVNATQFYINNASQLAGLSLIVNNNTIYYNPVTYDANVTQLNGYISVDVSGELFENDTISLQSDIIINPGVFSGSVSTYYYTIDNVTTNVNTLDGNILKPWIPIGNSTNKFKGIFDGNYHTIYGLYLSTTTNIIGGLFNYATNTIKNIKLENLLSNGVYHSGAVCSIGNVVDSCYVEGYLCNGYAISYCEVLRNCGANIYSYSTSNACGLGAGTLSRNCFVRGTIVATHSLAGFAVWDDKGSYQNIYTNFNGTYGSWANGIVIGGTDVGISISYVYASTNGFQTWITRGSISNKSFYNPQTFELSNNVTVNSVSYDNVVNALNAWVNMNDTSIYSSWIIDEGNNIVFDWM